MPKQANAELLKKQFNDEAERKRKWEELYVKAVVKEITITVDLIHGWNSKIREIYIPSEGIFFNQEACNMIHVGRYDEAKEVGETHISKHYVGVMKDYIKAKESIERLRKSYKKEFDFKEKLKKND